jgi:hypothetical protein
MADVRPLGGEKQVHGTRPHGSTDGDNPVALGMQAIAHGANPTAVTAGQRTRWYANRAGIPFVIGGHMNAITRRDNFTTAQTDTSLVTIGAGVKIVVTQLMVVAHDSNTVSPSVIIGFGTATTPTGLGVVGAHPGVPKGGGFTIGNGGGILGIGADDEDLRITSTVPTGGSITVITTYYTIPS